MNYASAAGQSLLFVISSFFGSKTVVHYYKKYESIHSIRDRVASYREREYDTQTETKNLTVKLMVCCR